jgi:transcriptional regulator with XRE-family HTH domain
VPRSPRGSFATDEFEVRLLGQQLKLRRLRLGLSQRELEAISGIVQSSISEIEMGEVVPETLTLVRLVDALDGRLRIEWRS